jgi:hypothetical protein
MQPSKFWFVERKRRPVTPIDLVVLCAALLLTALGYYVEVLGPPDAGGAVAGLLG